MKKILLVMMMCLFIMGGVAQAEEEVITSISEAEGYKFYEFDLSGEAKILWSPFDNSLKYGIGAEFAYAFDRILSLGVIWVPGENFDTSKGEGQKALYGPELSADILKLANLAKIEITFPETFQPNIGVAWLANMEGGIQFEDTPRITLTILSYDF